MSEYIRSLTACDHEDTNLQGSEKSREQSLDVQLHVSE